VATLNSPAKKVALVTPYYHPILGGITTFVDGLFTEFRYRGIDARVWTRFGDPGENIESFPVSAPSFVRCVRKRLLDWRPDVIHAHGHWYTLAASFKRGKPIAKTTVFTLHTEWLHRRNLLVDVVLGRLLQRVDVVTSGSQRTLSDLQGRFPQIRRGEVIPPGVRALQVEEATIAEVVREFDMAESSPRLCTVSMMVWPDKVAGIEILIRSMSTIVLRHPNAKLVIVGDGSLRHQVEDLVDREHLKRAVKFAGLRRNPAPVVLASDIVLHCSFRESFGQSVLESLSLGRPVIVNQEVAQNFPGDPLDFGMIVVPATPEGYADAVDRLVSDESLRSALASRGKGRVPVEFSWQREASRFLELYKLW